MRDSAGERGLGPAKISRCGRARTDQQGRHGARHDEEPPVTGRFEFPLMPPIVSARAAAGIG